MLINEVKSIYYILFKDLKAYYLKPPNISWGILFPIVMAIAFSLRSPDSMTGIAPGLVAMAALFGTTSMEAIVITFEKRVGALERLFLSPVSVKSILLAKILGGALFGALITSVMTLISVFVLGMRIYNLMIFIVTIILSLLTLSAVGALLAVSVKEVFEAQTLSNYFRFPMIFLCGVFIPVDSMPQVLQIVASFLPLTYAVNLLRIATSPGLDLLNILWNSGVLIFFLLVILFMSNKKLMKYIE
jgi:ABC-2 type transport system permease protein